MSKDKDARQDKEAAAPDYVFPGMTPFLDQVAADMGLDPHQMGRAQAGWHFAQIQQLLGQLPRLDPDSQQKMLEEHIYPIVDSHDGANAAMKAAVDHALAGCGIVAPQPIGRDRPKLADKKR